MTARRSAAAPFDLDLQFVDAPIEINPPCLAICGHPRSRGSALTDSNFTSRRARGQNRDIIHRDASTLVYGHAKFVLPVADDHPSQHQRPHPRMISHGSTVDERALPDGADGAAVAAAAAATASGGVGRLASSAFACRS